MSTGYPTITEVRGWVQVPATVIDDATLGQVMAAEELAQGFACDPLPEVLPADLWQSFLRRVARHVAARGCRSG